MIASLGRVACVTSEKGLCALRFNGQLFVNGGLDNNRLDS
jgi:hypothetical protein